MTNYQKGASFERQVKAELENRGALCFRSAGSHGISDLIVLWPGREPWLVQCKTNGKMSPAERREFYESAAKYGAWAVKASRPPWGAIKYERLFIRGHEQFIAAWNRRAKEKK